MNKDINILNIFTNKINLLDLNRTEIEHFIESLGYKEFVAKQIMRWIYKYYCSDFKEMLNLNKKLRRQLEETACIFAPKFTREKISCDGTIKWITSLDNNHNIETVYIPDKNRSTLCISSQIGCVLNCHFCATGKINFKRNLKVSEIIAQIWQANKTLKSRNINTSITNVVFMGMGEPLFNLKNVVSALKIILDIYAFNLSKRRITISTSGIVPALNKLVNMVDVNLAISLHASNDVTRNIIMPINTKYNIASLLSSVSQYLKKSNANHGGVTIEYVMLHGINDSRQNAEELARLLKRLPSKINLIPWNTFQGAHFLCSTDNHINIFANVLRKNGFTTIIRKNRGQDINAACGQLTGDNTKNINFNNKI
ncbi:23S rRNA (adenine(2503)-C(2))-methyltransferase RlmN [Buchnera aphidicola]|uniref:23S rRNA (adenine(2503)-C(2))-methyltransferase RlmN n=1 Tax=Buchnera aphidicola TaxID=9 RepID=UPI003464B1B8